MRRSTLCVLLSVGIVAVLSAPANAKDDKTNKKDTAAAVARLFPARVFGQLKHATCVKDPKGDWNYPNGQPPGLHESFVDIRTACSAYLEETPRVLTRLEAGLPCGPVAGGLVVCSPGNPPLGSGVGGIRLYAMDLAGDAPLQVAPDRTLRYEFFGVAAGDPATKSPVIPTSPNFSAAGTNVTIQAIENDPGLPPPSFTFLVIDHRSPDEFILDSAARILIRGRIIVFVIPERVFGKVDAVRGAAFSGPLAYGGSASDGDQDVVPGTTGPFGLIKTSR